MLILIILSNILLAFYLDPLNPLHERIIKGYTLIINLYSTQLVQGSFELLLIV